MLNKIVLTLVIVSLIVSISALFFVWSFQKGVDQRFSGVEGFYRKVEKEIELIGQRVPPYTFTGSSSGFVIEFSNGVNVYFAGDTALTSNLELVGKYFKPSIVFLPIGNIYTMDAKAAGFATKLINPEYVIPTNYGSFPELEQSPKKFLEELRQYKLKTKPLVFNAGGDKTVLGIKILWLGGKNWLLEGPQGTRILINPGIRYNPDFPRKYQELVQLKRIDLVLIVSGHFDNFTLSDTRKWGQLFDPVFISPYELAVWLKSQLPNYKVLALGEGSEVGVSEMRKLGIPEKNLERIKVKAVDLVPSSSASSVTPEGFAP